MSPLGLKLRRSKKVNTKAKETNVVKLQKEVNAIVRSMKKTYETHHLYGSFANGAIQYPYSYINLMNWSSLAPCYGTSAADYNTLNTFYSRMFELDMYFSISNEMANTTFSCYIVSLKKDTDNYSKTTGNLTLTTLTDYIDNISFSGFSQGLLNPKVFNIHWKKRFILGNNNVAATGPTGTGAGDVRNAYRTYVKIKTGKQIVNPEGNVQSLTCSQDPSHQYYLIMMNDNVTIDVEYPSIQAIIHHEIQTAN